MYDTFRMKHDMGFRSWEFCLANPFDAPRWGEFVGELEQAINDGRAYTQAFDDGRDNSRSATEARQDDREAILADIRDIVRIGKPLAREIVTLKGYFRVGAAEQALESLLARGRRFAAKVAEHQDHFTGFGFGPDALAAFRGRLDALEATLLRTAEARRSHVGARAEMGRVANRILYFVDCLDAINSRRFAAEPLKLAAWKSASKIAWPNGKSAQARKRDGATGAGD